MGRLIPERLVRRSREESLRETGLQGHHQGLKRPVVFSTHLPTPPSLHLLFLSSLIVPSLTQSLLILSSSPACALAPGERSRAVGGCHEKQ